MSNWIDAYGNACFYRSPIQLLKVSNSAVPFVKFYDFSLAPIRDCIQLEFSRLVMRRMNRLLLEFVRVYFTVKFVL